MKIIDRIYGEEEIHENVLLELIESPSMQRLKDVSQLGMPDKYYHREGYSRFEHSLGVLILLKRLGASLEEQTAGLLHDVSHTVFSHVIDWVVGDPEKEDYQDNNHLNIIKNSELKNILIKKGFDYKGISDYERFSLLERPAPSLCADRIDYCLREFPLEGGLSNKIFENLTVKENQIVFKDRNLAEDFAKKYLSLQKEHWAGDQARARYHILSTALKEALHKKIIFLEDLNKTESYVLGALESSGNEEILGGLNLLKKGFLLEEDSEGILLKKKFRYIDPEVMVNGSYKSLSRISQNYLTLLESEKENSKLIKKIKIIPK